MMEREQFDRVWRRVSVGMEETDEVSKLRREIGEATVLLGAYELLRSVVPSFDNDMPLTPFTEAVAQQIIDGEYIRAVEARVGKLAF